MSLRVNLKNLERKSLQLQGELSADALELNNLDELVRVVSPLRYDLEVETMTDGLLAQGSIDLELACECVRCLKQFRQTLHFADWACHVALSGEEQVKPVDDCVDLTPYIREDMVLAFPQYPLCEAECSGLAGGGKESKVTKGSADISPTWTELNKLKF